MQHSRRATLVVTSQDLFTRVAQILRNSQASPPVVIGPGEAQVLNHTAEVLVGAYEWNRYVTGKGPCTGGEQDEELCKLLSRIGGSMDSEKYKQYWLDIRGHAGTLCVIAQGNALKAATVQSAADLCDKLAGAFALRQHRPSRAVTAQVS
jgi:hypothetical protein